MPWCTVAWFSIATASRAFPDGRPPSARVRTAAALALADVVSRSPASSARTAKTTASCAGAGKTTHGGGRPRLLAYAQPEAALRNFGPRFNGGVAGEVLLRMAASDADCDGILVNSATQEISLIISRPTAQSLVSQSTTETADHQHQ